jgi:hypothetical protein
MESDVDRIGLRMVRNGAKCIGRTDFIVLEIDMNFMEFDIK